MVTLRRKSALNPSGHGGMSEGICLTTESISSFVNGSSKNCKSTLACSRASKSKNMFWYSAFPYIQTITNQPYPESG